MLSRHARKVLRPIAPAKGQHGRTLYSELSFSTKSDGETGFVGNYFSALRRKAANTLASNLPDEERSLLLDALSKNSHSSVNDSKNISHATINDEENEQTAMSYEPSVDEAIAAARLLEAKHYELKWEHDKETLIVEAEKAARCRVESDFEIQKRQIAFEAWKTGLEREKKQYSSPDKIELDSVVEMKDEAPAMEGIGNHPILGRVVADLGYKRIHLASAKNLATIPIWKKQRIYRHGRSQKMATDKIKTLHLGLPGVIGIFEKTGGSLIIIDGQHRVGMLKLMKDKNPLYDFDFENILVEVYPAQKEQNEDSQVREIFLEVNKAEPVKLVDLPGVAKAKDRKIITEVAERLQEKHPEMFSESQRCRSPNLNVDNLRDALFSSKILEKHSLQTSKALELWILERNELLGREFQDEKNKRLVSVNALKKARKFRFYLGLDSSWLYK